MMTNSDYALCYNEKTGCDEFLPVSVSVEIKTDGIKQEAFAKLFELMDYASHEEIVLHLTRLAVHRPKGSLGEIALPVFIEDIASDLKRIGSTSIGIALTCSHLRTKPDDKWFPSWPEIERAALGFESSIKKLRSNLMGCELNQIEKQELKPRPAPKEKIEPAQSQRINDEWEKGLERLGTLGFKLADVPRGISIQEFCDLAEKSKAAQ